ncbi:hypothetical protein IAQ61_011261 [Plenodomus lingam]|uniref:Similar to acetyltransferase n=1 Tax=Leptosphaeria maculans (strain JN3 / isolate v23.1.3 / race Av1-4-5-6-7-8) TaxID=985895 RepID=E5A9J0_LEPMJ|nr:similar to acetyltransferase [Plenodomus lingam JN3]KAH9859480.1 hypothetical protein IAQ61_011261 [Plenodomus lingam]CBY00331.1 similar to acetyltransferase [Plenodomus lingam JN3]
MPSDWAITKAKPTDADTIASLFAQSWNSPFTQLQFGHVDPATLAAAMSPAIARQTKQSQMMIAVARDGETGAALAVAQCSFAASDALDTNACQSQQEMDDIEDFEMRYSLPQESNKDLILEFTRSLRRLKHQVLKGQHHLLLENLATHPDYRGRGMASHLLEWIFSQADARKCPVYLNTENDNPAIKLYERMGFENAGTYTVSNLSRFVPKEDLDRYSYGPDHTIVAMVRKPNDGK